MYKKEKMVKVNRAVIEGLVTLNDTVDCHEKGCENCPAHMSKAIRINGEITRCMFILPGLLKKEIDKGCEKKMIENTPEAMQKVVEKVVVDLKQIPDCTEWECEECPFHLTEIVEDLHYGKHSCGWLLLRSATRKIMRK